MAMLPPGGPMEIVFSFDTTGSMSSCLNEVRGNLQDMVQRLQADIPGIKIAIIAHGDYCDAHNYVTKHVDFTDNIPELCEFVKNVGSTGGGDADECYELVLHKVHSELSWNPVAQKALVMIGDCNPHEPDYPLNTLKLDWRVEADTLGEKGVKIYAVQCMNRPGYEHFYKTIAEKTGGHHLNLSEFRNIFDFLMAVCYRERGEDFLMNYEKEVRSRCGETGIHTDLDHMFGALRDTTDTPAAMDTSAPALTTTTTKTKAKAPSVKFAAAKPKKAGNPLGAKGAGLSKIRKPKSAQRLKAFEQKHLPKLRRENVPETNFMLNHLKWSPWQLCITSKPSDSTWVECGLGKRARMIFHGDMCLRALYEFAVQVKENGKKYVMYSKFSYGLGLGERWDRKLLGNKFDRCIRAQIDDVLRKNCDIYVRRAVVGEKKRISFVNPDLNRYDYAWKNVKSQRKGHRLVRKSSVIISDSKY